MPQYIYIIAGFIIIYAVIFILYKNRTRKMQDTFNNLDLLGEARNARTYQLNYLDGAYAFIKDQMKSGPIDAFTVARAPHTAGDEAKDVVKNLLKGAATLGTVRFRTVHTPKYLVLSGDNLHLLDTDKEGAISAHLIFDRQRLLNSSLTEVEKPGAVVRYQKFGRYPLRAYKLSLSTDERPIVLDLYNAFMNVGEQNTATVAYKVQDMVAQFVVGSDFLNKLGDRYPNLKVPTDLPKV
ncbi:hypothetical protein A8C56_21615 [Niabella ginsenosidivorans]|uniref:Uncharacterized protein n=1 Tax=Niabella ginsenosidivorans TaxID=1176587 RepID=A0A1A9I6C4_9BACT|nr:hypothetical protein [Niabella ginsenosidivorans]ANH83228.1 hypothetical protein A8C56_21615 [Niabella ginsenosidivorans]